MHAWQKAGSRSDYESKLREFAQLRHACVQARSVLSIEGNCLILENDTIRLASTYPDLILKIASTQAYARGRFS